MNFLDSTGLEYFYGKLKEKFIRSVNSYTPDANGNVTITNVATADNLASPDGQTIYDAFIYRTSGGRASISNGEARLIYIDGNVDIINRKQESLSIGVENNIQATYDIATWRNQINETGLYNFNYIRPSSSQSIDTWNPGIGSWRYNNSIVSLSTFGIECSNIIAPSIAISTTGANIRNLKIIPNSWMDTFETSGTYVLTYNGISWILDGESITLNSLGITMTGTAEEEDKITINYQNGTPNSDLTVSYIAPEQGTILVSKPTAFESTGFNQFDKSSMYIQDASIVDGKIASNSGTYIAYCHAKGGVDNGYVAYSANGYIRNIGWCENLPTIGESVVTTGRSVQDNFASIPFSQDGYVVVQAIDISDLCIHPKWSGTEDAKYEDYVAPDVITLPTTSIDGQVLPLNSESYGMPAVGNIADRLNLDAGIYVQNIGRYEYSASNLEFVQGLGVDYDYDNTNIFYVLDDPIIYSVNVDSVYNVNDFGTEEFLDTPVAVKAYMLYGQNLRDKLRTGVVEKTGDTMSGALTISIPNDEANINFNRKNCIVTIDNIDKAVPIEAGIVPKSNTTIGNFRFIDSKETPTVMGYLNYVIRNNGNYTSTLNCRGYNASGARVVDNYLRLISKPDGTAEIEVSYPEAWRNGLDAVCKSGDTMTGTLNIDVLSTAGTDYVSLKSKNNKYDISTPDASGPTGNMYTRIRFSDKKDASVADISHRCTSGRRSDLIFRASNYDTNGSRTDNTLLLAVYKDKTPLVQMSNPEAWLTALGGGMVYTATAANIATAASGCTITTAQYEEWGKVVQLRLVITKTAAVTSGTTTLATLIAGKRPKMNAIAISSLNTYTVIGATGVVQVTGPISANASITVVATYMLP